RGKLVTFREETDLFNWFLSPGVPYPEYENVIFALTSPRSVDPPLHRLHVRRIPPGWGGHAKPDEIHEELIALVFRRKGSRGGHCHDPADNAGDAFFMVGTSSQPSKDGIVLPNEAGSTARLSAYSSKTIVLKLPSDKVVTDYKWFSVYRKDAEMSLGEVAIPSDFDYPRERSIGSSLSGAHRTHVGEVILKDMKTLFLKDFSYDGSAPDAFFLCGKGRPNPQGTKVPDENGRVAVIHGYSHADLTLTLPGELTMFDIDWFAVYCITYTEIFISVTIPKNPNIPPQMELLETPKQMEQIDGSDFENCETILPNRLQVAWKLESNSILFQLTTKLMPKEWAAFGISGDKDRNQMIGGDVAVVYLEGPSNKVKLEDYYLGSKAQCSITSGGVCPDAKSPLKGTDDLTVMSTKYENGLLSVVYSRPLATTDRFDKTITPAGETTVIAAQGPLAEEPPGVVLYHTMYWTKSKTTLKLNRQAQRNCQPLTSSQAREEPKTETQFGGRDILRREGVTTFTARIGPTGGSRGYAKITGTPGWGIVWWINDELIPVLHVERGKTYTFIAEGGHDDSNSARYHPFYITDSRKGGGSKEDAEALGKPGHLLLAGVTLGPDGKPDVSNAVGRYCEWEHKSIDQSNNVKTFEEFKKTLELKCEPNVKSGMFTWTPDEKTPDIVYYQCFTHYYLGWKILVKDPGTPDEPIASKTDTPGDPMTPKHDSDTTDEPPKHDSACIFGSSLLMTSMLACSFVASTIVIRDILAEVRGIALYARDAYPSEDTPAKYRCSALKCYPSQKTPKPEQAAVLKAEPQNRFPAAEAKEDRDDYYPIRRHPALHSPHFNALPRRSPLHSYVEEENAEFGKLCNKSEQCSSLGPEFWCHPDYHNCTCRGGLLWIVNLHRCAEAVSLKEECEASEQCIAYDRHSYCGEFGRSQLPPKICQCQFGFNMKSHDKQTRCIEIPNAFGTPLFDSRDTVPIVMGCLAAGLALVACCAGIVQLLRIKQRSGPFRTGEPQDPRESVMLNLNQMLQPYSDIIPFRVPPCN
ncbi:hypothetical protein HPB47_021951, partial [Ixodes persulcatus]